MEEWKIDEHTVGEISGNLYNILQKMAVNHIYACAFTKLSAQRLFIGTLFEGFASLNEAFRIHKAILIIQLEPERFFLKTYLF